MSEKIKGFGLVDRNLNFQINKKNNSVILYKEEGKNKIGLLKPLGVKGIFIKAEVPIELIKKIAKRLNDTRRGSR